MRVLNYNQMKKFETLIHPGGEEIEFNPKHAERLMAMPNNGGWRRKEDQTAPSDVKTDSKESNNGIRARTNKINTGESKE